MAVFHDLQITEFPDRHGQTYFLHTGQEYQYGNPEQHAQFVKACENYLAYLNEENQKAGKKEITNGKIHDY